MLPVATLLPKFRVVDVRADNLVKSSNAILLSDHIHETIVDASTMWEHHGASWRQRMEEEKLLLQPHLSVVILSNHFTLFVPLLHPVLIRECDAIQALQRVVGFL